MNVSLKIKSVFIILLSVTAGIFVMKNCSSTSSTNKPVNPVTFNSEEDYVIYRIKQEMGNRNVKIKRFNTLKLTEITVYATNTPLALISMGVTKEGTKFISTLVGADVYSKRIHVEKFTDLIFTLASSVCRQKSTSESKKHLNEWLKTLLFDSKPNTANELPFMGLVLKYNKRAQAIGFNWKKQEISQE